ncbi:MAG: hypothetical protein Q7N50_05075 [Armatimonadota bacterium]|nr:hypothetical protein [Armatimonadota bacterium]
MGQSKSLASKIARLLRPRLSDCMVVWLLAGLCFAVPLAGRINDPDIWWHLRTGELIVNSHSIPRVDPFSFTMFGHPWVLHEWMSEVVFWLTYSRFGFGGIVFLKGLLTCAIFSVMFLAARERTTKLGAVSVAIIVSFMAGVCSWSERPHLFGYLLLSVLILLLQRFRKGGSLWPVIPLFALWINFHGSWLVGLAVLMAAGAETLWEAVRDKSYSQLSKFAKVIPFVAAALFINPWPVAYVTYPFQYLGSTHHTSYISEWQSPDFHDFGFMFFLFTLLALPVVLRVSRSKIRPVELIVVLGLAGASLYSLRHLPIFALVAAPFLAEVFGSIELPYKKTSFATKDMPEPVILNWMILLALPLLIYILLPRNGPTPYLDVKKYPARSFDYLASKPGGGRLLINYDWGGYAIFRLWPKGYRVYIDGRADVYGPKMLNRVKILDGLKPSWRSEIKKANPDVIVWPKDKPLTQALQMDPKWRRIHLSPKDKEAAIFVPAGDKR